MKSQYFVIKNLNGEKRFVEVDEELTAEEFMAANGGHKPSDNAEWSIGKQRRKTDGKQAI